jgi:hypothetical protein
MSQFIIIVVVSLLLAWLSRRSLRAPGSHGFYRFFAWEAIALLIILNIPFWFDNAFSPLQIVSWSLLVLSICLAVSGFVRLGSAGGAAPAPPGDPNFGFENTTQLVTEEIRSYVCGVYENQRNAPARCGIDRTPPGYINHFFVWWTASPNDLMKRVIWPSKPYPKK